MKSLDRVKASKRSFNLSDLAGGNLTNLQANFLAHTRRYKHFHLLWLACGKNLSAFWLIYHRRLPSQSPIQWRIRRSWSCQDNRAVKFHFWCTQAKLNRPRNLGACVNSCMAKKEILAIARHLGYYGRFLTLPFPYPRLGSSSSHLNSWRV